MLRIRSLVIRFCRVLPVVRCDHCGRLFLQSDERGHVPADWRHATACPLCALFRFGHGRAWAVWNDCNGVFTESIFSSRQEAADRATEQPYAEADCQVVPVAVVKEPDWNVWYRNFDEEERGKWPADEP